MRGIADGAGLDVQDIIVANFIPELFHCSGFALSGSATKDGTLYHGRILDYGCDWRLQEHAVLTVAEPRGRIPFVNVTYAGFVGSVTGMNAERVSIGEMGARAWGTGTACRWPSWCGWCSRRPTTLDAAIAIFRDNPRTCEYYFVIADGEDRQGGGHGGLVERLRRDRHGREPSQTAARRSRMPSCSPPATATRSSSSGSRKGLGKFDAESARHLMDRPVAMKSNLHSVLFETTTTRFWVANASKDGKPASEQPYQAFQLSELLKHQADPSSHVIARPTGGTARGPSGSLRS